MALLSVSIVLLSVVIASAIYVLFSVAVFYGRWRREARVLAKFPGDPTHWLFGNTMWPGFNDDGLKFTRESVARHPRYMVVWDTVLRGGIQLRHPDVIKLLLKRSDPKTSESGAYKMGKPWLGEGLLMSNGQKWARNRKLLTNMFHFDFLRPYVTTVNQASELLLNKIAVHAEKGTGLPLFSALSLCTLDAMLKAAFSYDNDVQTKGSTHPYVKAVAELQRLWIERAMTLVGQFSIWNWTKNGRIFHRHCTYVHSISDQVIQKRRQLMENSSQPLDNCDSDKPIDFLDLLLNARDTEGNGLTDTEIRDEVSTFMFAGHDTTASVLSWTLYQLALHPDHQECCRQEVDALLDGRDSEHITWSDMNNVPYLTMCIKEAQRLHSIVPYIQRELKEELVLDGVTLPVGLMVSVGFYSLHHNPLIWENSMEYRPERFSPENLEKMDPFAFLPFSAGSRNCIGQHFSMHEQKVILGRILRRFTFSVDPDYTLETNFGIIIRPKDSLKLYFHAKK